MKTYFFIHKIEIAAPYKTNSAGSQAPVANSLQTSSITRNETHYNADTAGQTHTLLLQDPCVQYSADFKFLQCYPADRVYNTYNKCSMYHGIA